jgi:hypothetical protein
MLRQAVRGWAGEVLWTLSRSSPERDLLVGGAVVEDREQGVPACRLGGALGEQVGQGEVGFAAGEDFGGGRLVQVIDSCGDGS